MNEPTWDTACPDWESRIINRQSLVPFPPLFPDEAAACMQVLNDLRIVDAPGSPLIGESCAPWISDLAGAIFGAYNSNTGERLIQEFFLLISKKNAKSTIAAAIMLTVLIRNWRQSAEFIILAPTIEVANNAYAPARDMVKHDEELSALLHVQDHVRTITHRESGATLKVVAADQNTVGGKKAAVVLVDELHLFGKNPHAANMLREATGGLASRPEGFVIYLTTQSDQPPAGVFREKLQYARGVRDGTIVDPNFLPVIYEFPKKILEADDHRKPENFYITNPNMGYSVSEKFLIREMKKAEEAGEAEVLGFMSKHLNVEIGLALRSDRWAGADYWVGAAEKKLTLDDVIARSDVIDIGIDGGGLDDLLGFAAVGRDKRTRDWLVWTHAWAHPSVLERRKAEAPRFHDFEKDGDLTLSKRIGDDVLEVADLVEQVEESGLLDKVGVDPVGIGAIYDAMIEREIPPEKIVAISQGWKLGGAIKTAERKLAEGGMKHGGQPMMAWCVSNAKVEPRANSILITKQASGSAKIDPLMALFNAVTLISLNPESRGNDDFMAAIRNPIIV
ncbi:terminase large subunit [Pseudomonas sp. WJP1]|uniref:terminase large subunit n=1 Tax=Pseudomonas sp. WJP1 TaxID=2986947 RepID=UPI00234ABCF5|nr:terminase large subunit [Pseudomonas sp. WJP1]WCM48995.1 terminase large subunit [Pseudomonas sp. WJP1]